MNRRRGTRRELFNDECNEERMKLSIKKQRGRGPLLGIPKGEKPRDEVLALRFLAFPPSLPSFTRSSIPVPRFTFFSKCITNSTLRYPYCYCSFIHRRIIISFICLRGGPPRPPGCFAIRRTRGDPLL